MSTIRRRRGSYGSFLDSDDDNVRDEIDGFSYDYQDAQFLSGSEQKLPWKTICFVMFFLVVGVVCLITAGLIYTEVIDQAYGDRASPLLILGALMIIPGGYYSYVLSSILMKREGFSWEDIPEI